MLRAANGTTVAEICFAINTRRFTDVLCGRQLGKLRSCLFLRPPTSSRYWCAAILNHASVPPQLLRFAREPWEMRRETRAVIPARTARTLVFCFPIDFRSITVLTNTRLLIIANNINNKLHGLLRVYKQRSHLCDVTRVFR